MLIASVGRAIVTDTCSVFFFRGCPFRAFARVAMSSHLFVGGEFDGAGYLPLNGISSKHYGGPRI